MNHMKFYLCTILIYLKNILYTFQQFYCKIVLQPNPQKKMNLCNIKLFPVNCIQPAIYLCNYTIKLLWNSTNHLRLVDFAFHNPALFHSSSNDFLVSLTSKCSNYTLSKYLLSIEWNNVQNLRSDWKHSSIP